MENDPAISKLFNPVIPQGVFVAEWQGAHEPPSERGLYIVDLGHKRVCAAYWVPTVGWSLDHSEMIGLEYKIERWMQMPEGR